MWQTLVLFLLPSVAMAKISSAHRSPQIDVAGSAVAVTYLQPNRNNDAAAPQIRIHVVKVLRWVFIHPN